MDLGSLFSGLGFNPANSANPPNTAQNTGSLSNWIIIIILLFVAFRYGNLKSWFTPPAYGAPVPPEYPGKKHHKKHHKQHRTESEFDYLYPGYPQFQGLFSQF